MGGKGRSPGNFSVFSALSADSLSFPKTLLYCERNLLSTARLQLNINWELNEKYNTESVNPLIWNPAVYVQKMGGKSKYKEGQWMLNVRLLFAKCISECAWEPAEMQADKCCWNSYCKGSFFCVDYELKWCTEASLSLL